MTASELQEIEARWAKVSPIFKDDIDTLLAEVRRLKGLAKSRECCGNCEHFETVCGEGKCFVECEKPAWRFDKEVKYAEGNGKCDKWEAADNG